MKQFLRLISPKRAAIDFVDVWKQPSDHRWPVLGVAVALTFALFMLFIPESQRVEPELPRVIWVSTFDEARTDAEIIASNCANQIRQNELREKYAQRAELRKDMYKALGAATGMDVEAIEAQAEAERAAEEAKAEELAANDRPLDPAFSFEELCGDAAAPAGE